jgi:hypothetical protein
MAKLSGRTCPAEEGVPSPNLIRDSAAMATEWYVVHGGRAALVNGHNVAVAQDFALDLVQSVDGRTHDGSAEDLTGYLAWTSRCRG